MKRLLIIIFLLGGYTNSFAQYSRYTIQLKDKAGTPFSINRPLEFLTPRSISRRNRYHISIDQTDLPVTPRYIDSIQLSGNVTILNVSKWLNQVSILTTDAAALDKINTFSFVVTSSPIAARPLPYAGPVNKQLDPTINTPSSPPARPQNPIDIFNYGMSYPQIHLHNTEFLHNFGFRGEGLQVAIMDAGFYRYKTLPTFDSVRINNQILGTWDFVANEESVNEDHLHGMNVFSTIAANLPGSFVGSAPKSSFYLFRTEDIFSEYPIEEFNWAVAAERADSLGVDVASVSLGYNTFDNSLFNHPYAQLDGNTTLIAKAADLAAKKGMLVVVAAGNEGTSSWKKILTPADADSVLVVGAVNASRQVADFSSYGPSADGQIKPDVAAIGLGAVIADQNTGGPILSNGTSYACPIMAGVASCLWQAFPEESNMGIIEALRKSSDRANNPDDRTGYGIPDAKKAFVMLLKKSFTRQIILGAGCKTLISFTVKKANGMSMTIERKLSADINYVEISTTQFTGNFEIATGTYTDELTGVSGGVDISYRLKMSIGTDTSFYLDSATVNYSKTCTSVIEKISVSPNPVSDRLSILIARNNRVKATVIIYNAYGQKVYSSTQQIRGAQTISVPMKQISKGTYFVSIFLDDKKLVVKKIVRN